MRGGTKAQFIAVIVVALLAVILAWYVTLPRQRYNIAQTLVEIRYNPPRASCGGSPGRMCACGAQGCADVTPVLQFAFSNTLPTRTYADPATCTGTTPANTRCGTYYPASLVSFAVAPDSPTPAAEAARLIRVLTQGGGMVNDAEAGPPFVPTVLSESRLASNSVPSTSRGFLADFPAPMVITGTGAMAFAVPLRPAKA